MEYQLPEFPFKHFIYSILLALFCLELGWFASTEYALHVMNRKHDVMPIQDYSRLRDIEIELEKGKFLWF